MSNHAEAPSWRELMQGSARGDAAARDALARSMYPRVRERVHRELQGDFRKSNPWMMALFSTGDVVQDVFLAVLGSLGETEFADEDAFIGYLATLVQNRLVDAVRHHRAQRRDAQRVADRASDTTVVDPRQVNPALAAQLAEQAALLREVLQTFDDRRRALLLMRLVDGAPYAEIATKLGYASDETARQAFVDAQARLLVKARGRGLRPAGETMG